MSIIAGFRLRAHAEAKGHNKSPEEGGLQRDSYIGKAPISALFEPSGIWKIQHWNIERSNEAPAGCVYTHPFNRCKKGQSMFFHIIGIRDYYIHVGVGSDVVCSFSIGNFQGLRWWSGRRTTPRFLYVVHRATGDNKKGPI